MLRNLVFLILGSLSLSVSGASSETPARAHLAELSERDATWQHVGEISFPSGQLFFGDPTSGDDHHIRNPKPAPASKGQIWVFVEEFIWQSSGEKGLQNALIWIEFTGEKPVQSGQRLTFGADAATIGLGDLSGGQALVALGERWLDAGKGDSFEFISPIISEHYHFAKRVPIPGSQSEIFLFSTGADGGYEAVWLLDENGDVSGILVDVLGRKSDQTFIDMLILE